MKWETVKIFISSTFKDMHAERNYLVKNVFPELAVWCEERRLHILDIDLRWGITEADARQKKTVQTCMKNIDACRPFFLCFVGQRLGWIPEAKDVGCGFRKLYPELKDFLGKYSITELEEQYALSVREKNKDSRHLIPKEHAFFLLRDDACIEKVPFSKRTGYTNDCDDSGKSRTALDGHLTDFKNRIQENYQHSFYKCEWQEDVFGSFTCGTDSLKEAILSFLKVGIQKAYPDRKPQQAADVYEMDMLQQSYYMEMCAEDYLVRKDDARVAEDYLSSSDKRPLLIYATEGTGKTMFLADLGKRMQSADITSYIRFCGTSELSGSFYNVWKSILFQSNISCPHTLSDLRVRLVSLLTELSQKSGSGKTLVIIDALDQLTEGAESLYWIPLTLPPDIKLIVSLKSTSETEGIRNSLGDSMRTLEIKPFAKFRDKITLVQSYLDKYLKKLDNRVLRSICKNPASDNPLFLKILLTQLRMFGSFEKLDNEAKKYGNSPYEAFHHILEELETTPQTIAPKVVAENLFGFLSVSRFGLNEAELVYCIERMGSDLDEKTRLDAIRYYLRLMRPFLTRRGGCSDFLYNSFRRASLERYSPQAQSHNRILFECFLSRADPAMNGIYESSDARVFEELSYHGSQLGQSGQFEGMLHNCRWLMRRIKLNGVQSAISDYEKAYQKTNDESYRYFRDFLRLSSGIISDNPVQIPSQMFARLSATDNMLAACMLEQVESLSVQPWLKASGVFLSSPGDALIRVFQASSEITHIAVCGEQMAVIGKDNALSLWNLSDGERRKKIQLPQSKVTAFHFDADRFVIGKENGSLYLGSFNAETVDIISSHSSTCNLVFVTHSILCAAFADGAFMIFNEKKRMHSFERFSSREAFDCHKNSIYFALDSGELFCFDVRTNTLSSIADNITNCKALFATDNYVCWGDLEETIWVCHFNNKNRILEFRGKTELKNLKARYLPIFLSSSRDTYKLWRMLYIDRQKDIGAFDNAVGLHECVVSLNKHDFQGCVVKIGIWKMVRGRLS